MNAYALAILSPIFFVSISVLQFWLFKLYHRMGHPWSRILFPEVSQKPGLASRIISQLRKIFGQKDPELTYFRQFRKLIEKQEEKSGIDNP